MKSGLTKTVAELKRMDGHSSSQIGEARAQADAMTAVAKTQADFLDEFAEMREVVGLGDDARIIAAVATIRHVESTLKKLAQFHAGGYLVDAFGVPAHMAQQMRQRAEVIAGELLTHFDKPGIGDTPL